MINWNYYYYYKN